MNKASRCLMLFLAIGFRAFGDAAEPQEYSDAEIKEKYVFISRLVHGDENGSHIRKALRMAGNDTNRFARVLRELAVENTNQTKRAIRDLGFFRTPQSLPFLYSYATNATYGALALKAVFAIEGVTSNSVATLQRYLCFTNVVTSKTVYEKAVVCRDFLGALNGSSASADLKGDVILVVRGFASDVSTGVSMIDEALVDADSTYRYSKRRLADLRAAYPRCFNEYQTNYVTNAINELVAYPEANLPD